MSPIIMPQADRNPGNRLATRQRRSKSLFEEYVTHCDGKRRPGRSREKGGAGRGGTAPGRGVTGGKRDAGGLLFSFWQYIFRSEEHTSELQSLMRISSAVFCLQKKQHNQTTI